jgi:hypothetical protein
MSTDTPVRLFRATCVVLARGVFFCPDVSGPVLVSDESGDRLGSAHLYSIPGGGYGADLVLDYCSPERLDLQAGEPIWVDAIWNVRIPFQQILVHPDGSFFMPLDATSVLITGLSLSHTRRHEWQVLLSPLSEY